MLRKHLTISAITLTVIALTACQSIFQQPPPSERAAAPPPPPTAAPGQTGLPAAHLHWEWQEDARPAALATGDDRLAVIVSDGRFLWLDPDTGQSIIGGFLWPDELRGESWGTVSIYGDLALIKAVETFQDELGDFPATRSRVIAVDTQGDELWTLPQLGDKHLYTATISQGRALVGTNRGFEGNTIAAYDMVSGQIEWRFEADDFGFDQLLADEERVYSVLIGADTQASGMAAYDLNSGALLWTERDAAILQADSVLLESSQLYVLTQPAAVALNPDDGQVTWTAEFGLAPEAGVAARNAFLYVVPAPSVELGNQPGLLGIDSSDGQLVWHSLAGLVADPLAADGETLWAVVKDFNTGTVALSVLEAASGLEHARLLLGNDIEVNYQLVAAGDIAYVLGNSLRAYKIPR